MIAGIGKLSLCFVFLKDDLFSSSGPPEKLVNIERMDGQSVGKQIKKEQNEILTECSDVVVLLSDDDDVVFVAEDSVTEKMDITMEKDPSEIKKTAGATVDKKPELNDSHDSKSLLRFINKYCPSKVDPIACLLDTVVKCKTTPYCLYLYTDVDLGGGQSTSVILIGFYDLIHGTNVVRLFNTLQLNADPQLLSNSDMDTVSVDDAQRLLNTLKNLGLCLSNLAVFYYDAPHTGLSKEVESLFRDHNPKLVSLCGLHGIAGRACQSGILASFNCVFDLIRDIHHHYTRCTSVNDNLKEIFVGTEDFDPSRSISSQCLHFIQIVQRMVVRWKDLVEYYKSLTRAEDTESIRVQLVDYKIKLYFLFLANSLEPIGTIQKLQQFGLAKVEVEFGLIYKLIDTYARSIFKPTFAEFFSRKPALHLLQNKQKLLPLNQINVGTSARNFLWATAVVDLREEQRSEFLELAIAFYKTALYSLTGSFTEHRGLATWRNIETILQNPEKIQVRFN